MMIKAMIMMLIIYIEIGFNGAIIYISVFVVAVMINMIKMFKQIVKTLLIEYALNSG